MIKTLRTILLLAAVLLCLILLSTHDLDTALQLADRLWLQPAYDSGKQTAEPMITGLPAELIANGALARFFSTETVTFDPASRRLVARPK